MKGKNSVSFDVNQMMRDSGIIQIGSGKTRSMERAEAIDNGAKTPHDIGSQTTIHNDKSLDRYKTEYKQFFHFCRAEGYGRDYKTYSADAVGAFLRDKIDSGCSLNSLQTAGSALNKLDDILNRLDGGHRDFGGIIAEYRSIARDVCPKLDTETRRFDNGRAVVDAIQDDRCKLAAEIQLETGLRAMNVCKIQLNDNGTLYIHSKAGYRVSEFKVSQDLYDRLKDYSNGQDNFRLTDYKHYIYEIQKACEATGERYTGSHAFRHTYAYNSYQTHLKEGMTDDDAKSAVSKELFHERIDIVDKYLR